MNLTEEEFVKELFDIAVDGKGGLSGLEANLYKSKALKSFLSNQEIVERLREKINEPGFDSGDFLDLCDEILGDDKQ
jgi:hypothetical protein